MTTTDEIKKLAQIVETSESRREILRASARLQVITAKMLVDLTGTIWLIQQDSRHQNLRLNELRSASEQQASELVKLGQALESTGLIYTPLFDPVIVGIDTVSEPDNYDDGDQDDAFDDPLIDPDVDPAYDAPASSLRADGSPFVEPDPELAFPGLDDDDCPF